MGLLWHGQYYAKMCLQVMCGRPISNCADAQSNQGLSYPQTDLLDTTECFNVERKPLILCTP